MRKTLLSFISYMGCIAMAAFVTLFIEGTIGMILLYALVIALLASLLLTLAALRGIRVQMSMRDKAVFKGDGLPCEVRISNASRFPAAAVQVEIDASAHFSREGEGQLCGSVMGRRSNMLSFPLTAIHSGRAQVRIRSVRLTDFLGIFSFAVKTAGEGAEQNIAIYPDIPAVTLQTSFLRSANQYASDDEEESNETSVLPTGLAGYDHREYVPGDPLKRINWKLSSKRDILMVRLDEAVRASTRTLFLDCPMGEEDDLTLTVRDHVIEGALALLTTLLAEGREAVFHFCKQGLWVAFEIRTMADVYALQEKFSDFKPAGMNEILPPSLKQASADPICFTAAMKGNSASIEFIAKKYPNALIVCSHAASLAPISSNQWVLSDDFSPQRA